MIVQDVFAVRDLKAESFGTPFFAVNAAVATRMFSAAISDDQTPVGRNPEDFALFRVGVWNSETGALAGTDAPIHVVSALSLVKQEVR